MNPALSLHRPRPRSASPSKEPAMTDAAPVSREPSLFQHARDLLASHGLVSRALMLVVLTLGLKIPLSLVGGVVADRQSYEKEAVRSVTDSWGGAQILIGPTIAVSYTRGDGRN